MTNRRAQVRSLMLNLDQDFHIGCLANGLEVPGLQKDSEGYHRVGYYVAGVASAWVQQAKVRKKWSQFETKVVNVADKPCDWDAELWVKLKETA